MPIGYRTLAVVLLVCEPLVAVEWPQFRGPNGDGVCDATNVPIQWGASEHVVWKQPIPGGGWSSPVLWHGRVYVTTAIGADAGTGAVSLRAVCLDTTDGRIVWNVEVLRPDPSAAQQAHTKNGLASPTPIIEADRLYVHFGHMGTAALGLDGNILWRQATIDYRPRHGNGGSPVLVNDLLVFNCDAETDPFVVALDSATGEVRWKTPRNTSATKTFSFSTPTVIEVDGAQQIISAGSGLVAAYSPQDGREIWRVTYGEGYSVVPRPVFAGGLVYVHSGFEQASLLAIDPRGLAHFAESSEQNVPVPLTATAERRVVWRHEEGVPLTSSIIAVDDKLYFVSDNGVASCLDARTGRVHWKKRLGGDFSASPVFAEGRVYFQNEAGVTYVVKAETTFELLATNDLEERTLASPAVADDALFLRSESHLWRIGK
jgi:outer membrane protein assembly factor BamB